MIMKKLFFVCSLLLVFPGFAQDITSTAITFLNSLDSKLKSKVQYVIADNERFNWHFVPRQRNGVALRDFSSQQYQLVMTMLKASLSEQGYTKASGVVALESILREMENRGATDAYRDPLNYYVTIFGRPSKDKPWGWRFEGHHVSVNFMSDKNELISSTPSFFGSNPGIVPRGAQKGKELLKLETDLGFELCNELSADQKKKAIFSDKALSEIIMSDRLKAERIEPSGILYKEMNVNQQQLFMRLLEVYVNNYQLGFADKLMNKIKKAGIENLSFAWAGELKPGNGTYYRIQGPELLIEYDNTQNNANHVHTAVRDLTNDFAEDILRDHYKKVKH
jgi:hypothetical protein